MSSQARLGEVGDARGQPEGGDDRPAWTPGAETDPRRCQACGSHLSDQWRRCYGNQACPECVENINTAAELSEGVTPRHYGGKR